MKYKMISGILEIIFKLMTITMILYLILKYINPSYKDSSNQNYCSQYIKVLCVMQKYHIKIFLFKYSLG